MAVPAEKTIRSILVNDPVLQEKIGNRIHPVVLPEKSKLPALTYQRISRNERRDLNGVAIEINRWRFSVWGERYSEVKEIGEAVIAAFRKNNSAQGVIDFAVEDETDVWADEAGVFCLDLEFVFKIKTN